MKTKKDGNEEGGGGKRSVPSILTQDREPFTSITMGDGGIVAGGTEPDPAFLTHWLGCTYSLLPSTLFVNAVKREGNSTFCSFRWLRHRDRRRGSTYWLSG